jgi:prepilin-type N-terminal cleavage/methylation domain-containing protein
MKTEKFKAFTLPEILTVIVIIAIMVGILMPALSMVKKLAKDTKQKAQLASIEMALNLYRNDFGDYPPSHGWKPTGDNNDYSYCGAQTLAEAMFGQDLLGFHPDSVYRADGLEQAGGTPNGSGDLYPDDLDPANNDEDRKNLDSRKGPYLSRENISVFEANDIYKRTVLSNYIEPSRFVICDVFESKNSEDPIGGKKRRVGTPILYYKANPASRNRSLDKDDPTNSIYNSRDNEELIRLGSIIDDQKYHRFDYYNYTESSRDGREIFYGYIGDPQVTGTLTLPARPDSFLLISAGSDGLYGTKDDICNFEPNLPG